MATAKNDAHPRRDFGVVTQRGLKALSLATDNSAAIEPRLPAGAIDGLAADLGAMGVVVPGVLVTRATARTATKSQADALDQGFQLVTAIRVAVQRRGATAAVRSGYGVGLKINRKVVKQVKAAMMLILQRAAAFPGEAASLGILQKDLLGLTGDLAVITSVDEKQEQQRADAPLSTKERNRTANRILATIDEIVAAGVLEFARDAEKRAAFEALVSGGAKRKKQ